jgi:hypothetical protein
VAALSVHDPLLLEAQLPTVVTLPERLPPATVAAIGGAAAGRHERVLRAHGFRLELEAFEARSTR